MQSEIVYFLRFTNKFNNNQENSSNSQIKNKDKTKIISPKENSHVICYKEKVQDPIIGGCRNFHSLNRKLKL